MIKTRTLLVMTSTLLALAGCGGGGTTTTVTESQTTSAPTTSTTTTSTTGTTTTDTGASTSSGDLTPTFRSSFVAGCTRTAKGVADCGCIYDKLVSSGYTTTAQFAQLSSKISTASSPSQYPPEFIAAVKSCRS